MIKEFSFIDAGEVECYVRVADRYGAESEKTTKIIVNARNFGDKDALDELDNAEKSQRRGKRGAAKGLNFNSTIIKSKNTY